MKHTKGPWKYVDSLFIDTECGLSVAQVLSEDIKNRKEFISNAYLIAAAPEMLDVLLKIAGDTECPDHVTNLILPIIAKAKGS